MTIKQFVAHTIYVLVFHRHIRTHITHKIVITTEAAQPTIPNLQSYYHDSIYVYMSNQNQERLAHCIANCAHLLLLAHLCMLIIHTFEASTMMTNGGHFHSGLLVTSITVIIIIRIKHHLSIHLDILKWQSKKEWPEKNVDNAFFFLNVGSVQCTRLLSPE